MVLAVGVRFRKAAWTRVRLAPVFLRLGISPTWMSLWGRKNGSRPVVVWDTVTGTSKPHGAGVNRPTCSVELMFSCRSF